MLTIYIYERDLQNQVPKQQLHQK